MAYATYRKPPKILMSGRNFAIVLVVVVSALSFSLGYFVGRSTPPVVPETPVSASDIRGAGEPEVLVNPDLDQGDIEEIAVSDLGVEELPLMEPPEDFSPAGPAASPAHASEPQPARQQAIASRAVRKAPDEKKAVAYSIQVGAFQSADDAEALKKKVKARGYTAFVYVEEGGGDRVPHKVRVGRFDDRAKAEDMVLNIKRVLNLSGFIVSIK